MTSPAYKNLYTFSDTPEGKVLALRIFDEVGERCGSVALKGDYFVVSAPIQCLESWAKTFPQGWASVYGSVNTGVETWAKANISKGCYEAARSA